MLPRIVTKTTALIAAMSLLGTITPAAFAQEDNSLTSSNIEGVTQSNDNAFDISQALEQNGEASASTEGDGDATASVEQVVT